LDRGIVRAGAEHKEVIFRAQHLHVPFKLHRKLILTHARPRDLAEPLIALFRYLRGYAGLAQLFGGFSAGAFKHQPVHRSRFSVQHRIYLFADTPRHACQSGRAHA
jgi:hypothetical protein